VAGQVRAVAAGDFTGDGRDDVATTELNGGLLLHIATATGWRDTVQNSVGAASAPGPLLAADFDRDGRMDLFTTTSTAGSPFGYFLGGLGSGSFTAAVPLDTGKPSPTSPV